MNKKLLVGIGAFGGLLLIAGLALKTTPQETPQGKTESTQGNESPTIPHDIPYFPIYDGSITQNSDTDSEESRDISLTIKTDATKEDIYEWYRKKLRENGWSIKSDKNIGGYQIIQGENGNLYTSFQTAPSDDGFTIISQHLKIRK